MLKFIIGATYACIAVVSFNVSAALIGRLEATPGAGDYQAYYDDVAELTWLADGNYLYTNDYIYDMYELGVMGWGTANNLASTLSIDGITGWRLPDTMQPDASCSGQTPRGDSYGSGCTGSELGNMFYNVLGGVAGSSIHTTHNANFELFSNIAYGGYWSATKYAPDTNLAWTLHMSSGGQQAHTTYSSNYAWIVHSGDVSAVPIPPGVWLFGSGLIGLIGIVRRKKD